MIYIYIFLCIKNITYISLLAYSLSAVNSRNHDDPNGYPYPSHFPHIEDYVSFETINKTNALKIVFREMFPGFPTTNQLDKFRNITEEYYKTTIFKHPDLIKRYYELYMDEKYKYNLYKNFQKDRNLYLIYIAFISTLDSDSINLNAALIKAGLIEDPIKRRREIKKAILPHNCEFLSLFNEIYSLKNNLSIENKIKEFFRKLKIFPNSHEFDKFHITDKISQDILELFSSNTDRFTPFAQHIKQYEGIVEQFSNSTTNWNNADERIRSYAFDLAHELLFNVDDRYFPSDYDYRNNYRNNSEIEKCVDFFDLKNKLKDFRDIINLLECFKDLNKRIKNI